MPAIVDPFDTKAEGIVDPFDSAPAPAAAPVAPARVTPKAEQIRGTGWQIPRGLGEQAAPTPRAEPTALQRIAGSVELGLNVAAGLTNFFPALASGGLKALATAGGEGVGYVESKLRGLPTPEFTNPEQVIGQELSTAMYQPPSAYGQELTEKYVAPVLAQAQALPGLAGALHGYGGIAEQARGQRAIAGVKESATPRAQAAYTAAKLATPELEGIRAAHDAGFKLTAKAAQAGTTAQVAETMAGRPRAAQNLAAHNAENAARLAREDVGLPDDVPATPEATAKIRKEAGQDYAAVKDVGEFDNDGQYLRDLDAISKPYEEGGKDYKVLSENPIIKAIEGLRVAGAKTASAIEVVKDLRNKSDIAYRAGDKNLGNSYRAAASAVDNAMDRALGKMADEGADPALATAVDKYRAARVRIAKTYLLDDAMDGKPGEVNAKVYGRALEDGAKLDGPALQIAKFAQQFGDEGLAAKKGRAGAKGPTYHDILLGALIHAPAATLGAAAVFARPAVRAVLASDFAQKRMAGSKPAPGTGPRAVAPEEVAFNPGLDQGFEDVRPPGTPLRPPPESPLGDLTPDWETSPGAGGAPVELQQGQTAVPPGASVSKLGIEPRPIGESPLRPAVSGEPGGAPRRAGEQIPAVPGRPDLVDTLTSDMPATPVPTEAIRAEAAATEGTPAMVEARRQQNQGRTDAAAAQERAEPVPVGEATQLPVRNVEPAGAPQEPPIPVGRATELPPEVIEPAKAPDLDPRLLAIERELANNPSEPVRKALEKRAAQVEKDIKAEKATQKKLDDATELRKAARDTVDPDIKKHLLAEADKLDPPSKGEKIPAGEATEGEPNAAAKVTKQEGVQQERGNGNEGGAPAETGTGNRVQREAQGKSTTEGKVNEDLQGTNAPSGKGTQAPANDVGANRNAAAEGGNNEGAAAGQGNEGGAKKAEVKAAARAWAESGTAPEGAMRQAVVDQLDTLGLSKKHRDAITEANRGDEHLNLDLLQTKTPAFRNWFRKSKVVDEKGEPLVVHHSGGFDANDNPVPRVGEDGFHFGTKQAAEDRNVGFAVDDYIRNSSVNEENGRWYWKSGTDDSYEIRGEEGFASEKSARRDVENFARELAENDQDSEPMNRTEAYLSIKNPKRVKDQVGSWKDAIAKAKKEGYDGLVYRNEFEDKGKDSYVAFEPTQIKSATNNRGTFDPNDPNISHHLDLPKIDEGFMHEQQKQQADAAPPVSDRGIAAVRTALQKGMADGTLDKDGVSLALWMLDRNPNLAKGFEGQEGLHVTTISKDAATKGERGAYNSARQLIRLVEGFDGTEGATHEILHHTERMMPTEMRDGIRREWRAAIDAEIKKTSESKPEVAAALKRARDAVENGFTPEARKEVLDKFYDRTLNTAEHYELVNPSEYWAKNATRILSEKFNGRGSWRAEAVRWLKDLMEHIKGTIGLRSDAPILKALEAILNPEVTTGEQTAPSMLAKAGSPPGK